MNEFQKNISSQLNRNETLIMSTMPNSPTRLFTIGCSMTRYHWPTWADIIGREFDHFENWGNSGLGNRAIAERLSELSLTTTFTENDVIIIQWSEPHRFDLHKPDKFPDEPWFTGGNIFNSPLYNAEWAGYYWNSTSYVMHTMNFINMSTAILNSLPCKWYFLSMNDLYELIEFTPELNIYLKLFNDKWLPPIKPFFDQNYKTKWFKKPIRKLGITTHHVTVEDPHPTPIAHFDYVQQNFSNLLNMKFDQQWAEKATDLLDSVTTHEDIRECYINNLGWDNRKNWIRGL